MTYLQHNGGNGHGSDAFPVSRKALLRHLPRRLGALEDQIEACEQRVNAIAGPAAGMETTVLTVRLDNLVDAVSRLSEQVRRIDRRSARSRRRVAVIADQLTE
jgi:hypothetical protein